MRVPKNGQYEMGNMKNKLDKTCFRTMYVDDDQGHDYDRDDDNDVNENNNE